MTTTIENCIAYNNEGYPQKFCGNIYVGCVMNNLEFGDDINRGKCLEYVCGCTLTYAEIIHLIVSILWTYRRMFLEAVSQASQNSSLHLY